MPHHCNPNRPKAHTQPPEPPASTTSRDSFWKCAATPAARGDETNATPPSSRESLDGMELSRHTQPPCPSHSPADCSRTGAETSGDEVNIEASRRAGPSLASHRLPLSPTRREEDRQDLHEADSMWSRITSVSRRGFTRIYEFLTGSRGSTTEAASQGSLDPNRRHFSPPPPPGGGVCAGPPP